MSLFAGLVLVVMLMQMADSPATKRKLELLFGDETPPSQPDANNPSDTNAARSTQPLAYLAGVDQQLLKTIENNSQFVEEETEAWFHLWELLLQASDEELQSASMGKVVYPQLIGQPLVYRGRIVEFTGIVRRIETVQPAENDLGIERLYRVVVQPGQHGQMPVSVYCLDESAESRLGDSMRVKAFFFKNRVYKHEEGIDLMPVLLARTYSPQKKVVPLATDKQLPPAWQLVALAGAMAAVVVIAIATRSGRESRRPVPAQNAGEIATDLSRLDVEGADSIL